MLRGFGFLALLALLAVAARAEDEKKQPAASEKAATDNRKAMDAMVTGMTKFVGETRLNEKGIKAVIQHFATFAAIGEGATENDPHKLVEASFKKTGVYDFGVMLQHPAYKKWVEKTGVDGKAWLQQWMRALLIFMREEVLANHEQIKLAAKSQLAELERLKAQLGEQQYQKVKKALEESLATAEAMAKAVKKIPEADKAEQVLLKTHGEKLRGVMGAAEEHEDDEGCEDEDDDDGDDDDDGGGD